MGGGKWPSLCPATAAFCAAHSEQIDFLPLWPLTRLSSALPCPADDLKG